MKNLLTGILLFLFTASLSAQQAETLTSFHVKDISFARFCSLVTNQTSVKVFYQDNWVNKIQVTLDMDNTTALTAVAEALKGTGLEVSAWHGNLLVMPGEKLLTDLPPYETRDILSKTDTSAKALTASE